MKFIPRSKNVGLVFFGVLIVTAFFLFLGDKVGDSGGRGLTSTRSGGETSASTLGRQGDSSANGGGVSLATFPQADWPSVLGQTGTNISLPTSYSPTDLQIKESPTKEGLKSDLRTYASDLKQALRRYSDPKLPNEMKIMLTAYEANDSSGLSAIGPLKDSHTMTLADLANIKVPGEMTVYHLMIMNALKAMSAADDGMKLVFTNQDIALSATKAYTADLDSLHTALQKISALILKRGVILPESEKLKIYLGNV